MSIAEAVRGTRIFDKTPGVLAFTRGLLVTDAQFFSRVGSQLIPVPVVRHGFRGTQNNAKKGDSAGAEFGGMQLPGEGESALLHPEADALVVWFEMSPLPLLARLHSCAGPTPEITRSFREVVQHFVKAAVDEHKSGQEMAGLTVIGRRIARLVANGSWLWRNREDLAADISIEVRRVGGPAGEPLASFKAFEVPFNDFTNDEYTEQEKRLAGEILADLAADPRRLGVRSRALRVTATITPRASGSQVVHPSQCYVPEEEKTLTRVLYKINPGLVPREEQHEGQAVVGYAALRDQKVANRLRAFDTWYPGFEERGRLPIPVEPTGASLELMERVREDDAHSGFGLLARLDGIAPGSGDGMYCIGLMLRGGVYGTSDKQQDAANGQDKAARKGGKKSAKASASAPSAPPAAPTGAPGSAGGEASAQ